MNKTKLNHACKGTCSGWQDGFEQGEAEIKRLREALEKIAAQKQHRIECPNLPAIAYKALKPVRDSHSDSAETPVFKPRYNPAQQRRVDMMWEENSMVTTCYTCGEPHEMVRPGKTQAVCECDEESDQIQGTSEVKK